MAEYTDRTTVTKRLTDAAVKWIVDRNKNGTLTEEEYIANIDTPIEWAGRRIDTAICEQIDPTYARAQGCLALKDLCTDIAAFRAAGQGGRELTESSPLREAYEAAMAELERYSTGRRIPGMVYPQPVNAYEVIRVPASFNPKRRR